MACAEVFLGQERPSSSVGKAADGIWNRGFAPALSGIPFRHTASTMQQSDRYLVRDAKPEEQRELTRLCVRATLHTGYDDAFVDRVMPGLTVMLPLITAGAVQVAEQPCGAAVGVVTVTTSGLPGVALLHGLYVDPPFWKRGIGRVLFEAAVTRARGLKTGGLMIYAEPSAEDFYKRLGAIRIGEGPFYYSPDVVLPHLFYVVPQRA
jgi:GNAT superfamily N-acetyltransferase